MRRIALGAGGIATLVILVALGWSGLKPGIGFGPPPVIQAPPGPLRVAPTDPGGLTVPEADEQIMSGDSSTAPAQLAPAEPAPDIAQLQQEASPAVKPSVASPPAPVVTPPVSATVPAVVAGGTVQVQLAAAVDSAGAKSAWLQAENKMPDLLAGRTPVYSHAIVAGVEFWRVRVGGFADVTAATSFCAAVKAKGGACTVAAF
jgi:hypothetical protein